MQSYADIWGNYKKEKRKKNLVRHRYLTKSWVGRHGVDYLGDREESQPRVVIILFTLKLRSHCFLVVFFNIILICPRSKLIFNNK